MTDHVREHWPHVAALLKGLDELDGRTVTVTQQGVEAPRDNERAQRGAEYVEAIRAFERQNGAVWTPANG